MKNILIKTVIFLFAITFIALQGCKKDTNLTNVKLDPTEQKILNFKEKMQNPNKSNETMSIDSAVWYIEAALNYTYCDSASNVIGIDSIFVPISTINNEINFNDVTTAYNQLDANLQNALGENTMRVADVEFVENANKSGDKELKLTIVETKSGISNLTTFGPDDYWHFSELNGKCDGSFYGTRDAVTQLNVKANMVVAVPYGQAYVTDVEEICQWEIYWIDGADYCCEPNQLNDWLTSGKSDVVSYKPANKSILSYEFWQDIASGKEINTTYGLTVRGHYGIWHISSAIED